MTIYQTSKGKFELEPDAEVAVSSIGRDIVDSSDSDLEKIEDAIVGYHDEADSGVTYLGFNVKNEKYRFLFLIGEGIVWWNEEMSSID